MQATTTFLIQYYFVKITLHGVFTFSIIMIQKCQYDMMQDAA